MNEINEDDLPIIVHVLYPYNPIVRGALRQFERIWESVVVKFMTSCVIL